MSDYLAAVDWLGILTVNLTATDIWSAFTDVLRTAIDLFVPTKLCEIDPNKLPTKHKHSPNRIKQAITRKRCLWRTHRTSPRDEACLYQYRIAEEQCRKLIYNYEVAKDKKLLQSNNIGIFYKYANRKMSNKSGYRCLVQ